jgi:hypothetical protein
VLVHDLAQAFVPLNFAHVVEGIEVLPLCWSLLDSLDKPRLVTLVRRFW